MFPADASLDTLRSLELNVYRYISTISTSNTVHFMLHLTSLPGITTQRTTRFNPIPGHRYWLSPSHLVSTFPRDRFTTADCNQSDAIFLHRCIWDQCGIDGLQTTTRTVHDCDGEVIHTLAWLYARKRPWPITIALGLKLYQCSHRAGSRSLFQCMFLKSF